MGNSATLNPCVSRPGAVPGSCSGSERCFSLSGCPGALLRSPLRRRHRDSTAAAQPGLCHLHQRQQSRQVPHPSLPELVSFLLGTRLPVARLSLGASSCRQVGRAESPSWSILLAKLRAFFASSSMFSVVHTQLMFSK